ncbi:thiamine phosphate synthase [Cohnella thermotolerans]|uniref:thiamine phosphate synthase n=1 Tax=Cohnella thermotolerans TaxID=329858 RepID=UPI000411F69D|nr:thiamine phosphate synthase [Cohnella thermotolerans]
MRSLNDCKLYVITGENYHKGRDLLEVMEAAIRGGADIVQLRDKDAAGPELLEKARALRELTRRLGALFIVNDHPEIALAAEADGVHLGQEDLPIEAARALVGPDRLIGISTHSIGQARAAERAGADYIGVGPVYPTGTKPGRPAVGTGYVAEAAEEIRIPFFAIGGIHPGNAEEVLAAGARRLCAVSAVVGSPDPAAVCRELRALIERAQLSAPLPRTGGGRLAKTVVVNGRAETTDADTLQELAASFRFGEKLVVAERNGEVVPRADWTSTPVGEGDRIEFVHFVGGG